MELVLTGTFQSFNMSMGAGLTAPSNFCTSQPLSVRRLLVHSVSKSCFYNGEQCIQKLSVMVAKLRLI